MMSKRKTKREPGTPGEAVRGRNGEGEVEGVRYRSRTVMEVLRSKLRRKSSAGGGVGEDSAEFSFQQKCATLPARVGSGRTGSAVKGEGGGGGRGEGGKQTRTLYWMEEFLGPFEESLKAQTVSRKDSDESVDSGFEQTHKQEGSETDSNSSPGQSKALLLATSSLGHDTSGSFQEEPRYQSVQGNSMYDEMAFDKAFGPMKDVGRWYSSYSSQKKQQQQSRDPARGGEEGEERGSWSQERSPAVPPHCSARSSLEEYEERLVSRPLPPIPPDPAGEGHSEEGAGGSCSSTPALPRPTREVVAGGVVTRGPQSAEDMYELVELRMRGNNPLMLGLRNVARHGWYWGPISRMEAEEKLQGANDGTFLVRDSSDERYLLSLSFRSQGKSLHTRIEYSNGFFSFYSFPDSDSEGYKSVVELIERSMKHSQEGVFCFSRGKALGSPAVPVRLLKPLSRFNQVRSLQHYCRFVIRQSIRFDCIRQLPLPRHVHGYLEQSQY